MSAFKSFLFSFDLTLNDFPVTPGSQPPQTQLNNAWQVANTFNPNTPSMSVLGNAVSNLPTGSIGAAGSYIMGIANMYQVSFSRFTQISMTPVYQADNKNLLKLTISAKITNGNLDSPPLPNDYLSANALGNWVLEGLKVIKFTGSGISSPEKLCNISYNKSFNTLNEPNLPNIPVPAQTVLNQQICSSKTPSISNFTSNIFEHNSNVSGGAVESSGGVDPVVQITSSGGLIISKSFDFLFQYSYLISFIGAISISFIELLGLNPLSIFNEKLLIFFNVIISLSSIVALFTWFNTQLWYVDPAYINVNNVAKKNNIPFIK
jgi:hypothetical protein